MRIAMMLRAYDRPGGIGIYSRNIVKHLLKIDKENHYILIYNQRNHLGTYNDNDNVDEIFIPATNALIWDQILVPSKLEKWSPDLIFHTKFTVPVILKCKKIMALHGASWFVHPELYKKYDIFYIQTAMPLYCRKADYLISNSDLTTQDFIKILNVPKEKIETVYLAADENFHQIIEPNTLQKIKDKHKLPENFILTVTSYDPRKNFPSLIKAFEQCRKKADVHLVVVGKNCDKYAKDFDLKKSGLEKTVHFTGWIDQLDLPAFYSLAKVFVFPSVYEEFGIPVIEAMSCGCPVVSSNTGAIPQLTKGAALLGDPFDHHLLAENIMKLFLSKPSFEKYQKKGLVRAKEFSWIKTATKTLEILQKVYND